MATLWAKVDSFLPINPKAFASGFWGTTIFMHLILINKAHGCDGLIPVQYARPEYLARYLQIDLAAVDGTICNGMQRNATAATGIVPCNDGNVAVPDATGRRVAEDIVRLGLRLAMEQDLISVSTDGVRLNGWDEDWDKEAMTSTERSRKRRKLLATVEENNATESNVVQRSATEAVSGNGGNECNAIRVDQNRSDQSRVEVNKRVDSHPPESTTANLARNESEVEVAAKPKPKSKQKATTQDLLLAAFGDEAGELWDYQELLRASVMTRSRPLKPTPDRLARVCALLNSGISRDDCEAVLKQISLDVKRDPGAAKHFNGVTNWRPQNFDRTLGGVGVDEQAVPVNVGRVKPMEPSDSDGGKIEIK